MPGQMGARYDSSPKNITDMLEMVRTTGRPDKLTASYVKDTWLLEDNNMSSVLPILEDMGFIDGSGIPLERYAAYQNKALSKQVLAEGIGAGYPDLFKAYPDAGTKPRDLLEGYFKQKTGAEKSVLDKIVATFFALCSMAEFSEGQETLADAASADSKQKDKLPPSPTLLPLSMNIQIIIPSDASEEQYDKIFASIKKFLTN